MNAVLEVILAAVLAFCAEHWKGVVLGAALVGALNLIRRYMNRKHTPDGSTEVSDSTLSEGRVADVQADALMNAGTISAIRPEAARSLGILECLSTLERSNWTPDKCRARTRSKLYFAGFLATKWVTPDEQLDEFEHFLKRLSGAQDASVQFLLLDPFGSAIRQIHVMRSGVSHETELRRHAETFERHRDLMRRYPFYKIRLYDHVPYFRIVIVDGDTMAVTRYKVMEGREFGWKAPHLILRNDEYPERQDAVSLFYAFERYYEHMWGMGRDAAEAVLPTKSRRRNPPKNAAAPAVTRDANE
jgi:Domain of unknown function (DUF5919)